MTNLHMDGLVDVRDDFRTRGAGLLCGHGGNAAFSVFGCWTGMAAWLEVEVRGGRFGVIHARVWSSWRGSTIMDGLGGVAWAKLTAISRYFLGWNG